MSDDVPLKDYIDAKSTGLLHLGVVISVGVLLVIAILDVKNDRAVGTALRGVEEATKVAKSEAKDALRQHNGLIDRMRELSATYVTKGNVMSFLVAIGICATVYAVFLRGVG